MIFNPYSKKQHTILWILSLIVGIIIIYTVFIMPAVIIRHQFTEKKDDLQFQYSRFSRVESQKDAITRQLEQLKTIKTDKDGFLNENSSPLAAAELQEYIKKIIESNGGILTSTQAIDNQVNSTFPQATIKVQMRCNIDSLQRTIYQIETGFPVLLIDKVYIQGQNIRRSRNTNQGIGLPSSMRLLDVRFEVTGFIYQGETV